MPEHSSYLMTAHDVKLNFGWSYRLSLVR